VLLITFVSTSIVVGLAGATDLAVVR